MKQEQKQSKLNTESQSSTCPYKPHISSLQKCLIRENLLNQRHSYCAIENIEVQPNLLATHMLESQGISEKKCWYEEKKSEQRTKTGCWSAPQNKLHGNQ